MTGKQISKASETFTNLAALVDANNLAELDWRQDNELDESSRSRFLKSLSAAKSTVMTSATRLGDLLDFGQLFKAFGNN